jgi:hypothetical protein
LRQRSRRCRYLMRVRFTLLLILVCSRAASAQTTTLCPWLSTGSAVTALGGSVTVTVHSENNWQGECRFTRQGEGARQTIDVQVSKVNPHPCPQGSTRLKALGNEAVQCSRSTSSGVQSDTIAGRVKDAWFEVAITGSPGAAREAPLNSDSADPYGASLLEQLAEQVAGNLF